ncbi:MAG: hypothetical protein FWD51_03880 [Betaproteobacteria bacterium]|nr:hypothetical protein [Betaproteobacteria bacterium]
MTIYSSKEQLIKIAKYLSAYMRIPYFQEDSIPGKIMEKIISLVHSAEQLTTYDYVDVCREGDVGWQVKSTKVDTPLTWKRAKIPNSDEMIKESENSSVARQKLGDAIIDFCNNHAKKSLELYNLKEIGYCRLIIDGDVLIYFERLVSSRSSPNIFEKNDYQWVWSEPKKISKKEQLSALHGIDIKTQKKIFAWHGKGENQFHFSGEKYWWPHIKKPEKISEINFSADDHAMAFKLPFKKVSWGTLVGFLNNAS